MAATGRVVVPGSLGGRSIMNGKSRMYHGSCSPRRGRCLLFVMTFITPVMVAGVVSAAASAASFTVLHRFSGGSDGWRPVTALTQGQDLALYGMTAGGGGAACPPGNPGPPECGTVFKLTPPGGPSEGWRLTTLYRFQGGQRDGVVGFGFPEGGPVLGEDGSVYGTNLQGGIFGVGTAFKLTPPSGPGKPWRETILYNFVPIDGSPWNSLVAGADGAYYGISQGGGSPNCGFSGSGTLFELTPPAGPGGAWTEAALCLHGGTTTGT
jgi:hypothetical protein